MSENTSTNQSQTPSQRPQRTFSPRSSRPNFAGNRNTSGDRRSNGYSSNQGTSNTRFGSRSGGPQHSNQRTGVGNNRRNPNASGQNRFQNRRRGSNQEVDDRNNFQSKVIQVRRVTRVVKGGKRMRFSALVVVGDLQGQFGVGLKKGNDYADAVNKATSQAKKNLRKFILDENGSIPYSVTVKFKAAQLFLKPAVAGTGLIAGGPIRGILELAGVKNVLSKIIGSNNKITNVLAVYKALSSFANSKPIKNNQTVSTELSTK